MDTINTSNFVWDKSSKKFIAFISDINKFNLFGRIYPDACDAGFDLVSDKTGNAETVSFYDTIWNDGEVGGWVFKPINSSHDFSVVVFND
jgi:hypothetical protein